MDNSPQDWKEYRRLRALDLYEQGWRNKDIARALDVTPGAVSQWLTAADEHGPEALRTRKALGAVPKLTTEQFERLPELLKQDPEAYGFRGSVWTCSRVTELVRREFAVQYSKAHMSRILKRLDWTPQKPVRWATQRDEVAIERWRHERWPALKKKPCVRVERSYSWTNALCTYCRAS